MTFLYLQLFLHSHIVLLELLNSRLSIAQIGHALIKGCIFLLQLLFLGLDFVFHISELILGLLHFLIGPSRGHFSILKISLELVIPLLQLVDLFQLLGLNCAFLLLLVGEFVEKLAVVGLGHARTRLVCCGGLHVCHVRARTLIELVTGGAARRGGRFQADFDPGAGVFALVDVDTVQLEILIAELSQVKVTFAQNSTCFITGNGQIGL